MAGAAVTAAIAAKKEAQVDEDQCGLSDAS
jgi:hypothetical protein